MLKIVFTFQKSFPDVEEYLDEETLKGTIKDLERLVNAKMILFSQKLED